MDRKAKISIVPERVAKGAARPAIYPEMNAPALAISIGDPRHGTRNANENPGGQTSEKQMPARPELGVKDRALGAQGVPKIPLEPAEAKLVPKALEMFEAREREGRFAFEPSLVQDLERGLRVDSRTAHRIFLFAMQRYVPGKPGIDAHMKR